MYLISGERLFGDIRLEGTELVKFCKKCDFRLDLCECLAQPEPGSLQADEIAGTYDPATDTRVICPLHKDYLDNCEQLDTDCLYSLHGYKPAYKKSDYEPRRVNNARCKECGDMFQSIGPVEHPVNDYCSAACHKSAHMDDELFAPISA